MKSNNLLPKISINLTNIAEKNPTLDNPGLNKLNYDQKAKDNFYKILNYFDNTNDTADYPTNYIFSNPKTKLSKKILKTKLIDPNTIINDIKLKYDYKDKIKKLTMDNITYSTPQLDTINSVTLKAKSIKRDDDQFFNTKFNLNEYL